MSSLSSIITAVLLLSALPANFASAQAESDEAPLPKLADMQLPAANVKR